MDEIIRYVHDEELEVGDKLPPERVFMELFGVGRSSLREALRILSATGVINVVHGDGMYLASSEPEARGQNRAIFDASEADALRNLVETRLGIEFAAVTALAERGTPEHFDTLAAMLRDQRANMDDDPDYSWKPLAFELAVASMSGNTWLYEVETMLRDAWVSLSKGLRKTVGRPAEWHAEHGAILASMRSGNVAQAQRLVVAHLSYERFEVDLRKAGARTKKL